MNFRSERHQVFTIKQTKKSLSPFDDKRYILEDGYTTRAHGHYLNGITRPFKAVQASEEELATSMNALSLTSTNNASLSKADMNSGDQSIMDLPLPPPTNDKFHAYLASFWK